MSLWYLKLPGTVLVLGKTENSVKTTINERPKLKIFYMRNSNYGELLSLKSACFTFVLSAWKRLWNYEKGYILNLGGHWTSYKQNAVFTENPGQKTSLKVKKLSKNWQD